MKNEKRLIDANAVIKKIDEYYHDSPFPHPGTTWLRGLELAVGLLLNEPTVDAVEVVHAEWTLVIDENDCECIECPLCGEQFYDGDNDTFDKPWNYCPNCGAKMDGDTNE